MDSKQWDRELAKIDRQLESMSDDALLPSAPGAAQAAQSGQAELGRVGEVQRKTTTFGVFSRLVLAVALGVAMLFWPYSTRCGVGLFAYLGAALMVIVAGVWTSRWTWRHHSGQAHVLSLLLIVWGVVLGAAEILPRVGYALPDTQHPAVWTCE